MISLCFCFPYRGIGGVSLLFLRVARYLESNKLAKCYLIDYPDGCIAQNKGDATIQLIAYSDLPGSVSVPNDAILVFQSMTPWSIYPGLKITPDSKILFWNCHPFNLIPLLPGLRRYMQHSLSFSKIILATLLRSYRTKMRKLVEMMLSKESLVFMDSTNLYTTERYLGVDINNPYFLPVPAVSAGYPVSRVQRNIQNDGLRIISIGRIVDFKYYSLLYALQELDRVQPLLGHRIIITIVGTGEYIDKLNCNASLLRNIVCEFVDHVEPDKLDQYLITNCDMQLAMGTSALESAKLGIPTLLLDVAYAPILKGYKFSWLYDRSGYTLGDTLQKNIHTKPNDSMLDRVKEVTESYEDISYKTRQYFLKNHDISCVASKLLDAVKRTSCTYGDLLSARLLDRGWVYSSFTKIRNRVMKK